MIRAAEPGDLAELVGLEVDLFGVSAWSERSMADEVRAERVLLTEDEAGVPTGYVVVSVAGDVADLRRIGVRRDHQRRGLAGILLAAAVDRVPAERIMLEVSDRNDAAIALYLGHGFTVLDRRRHYYPDGSDAWVMSREMTRGWTGD